MSGIQNMWNFPKVPALQEDKVPTIARSPSAFNLVTMCLKHNNCIFTGALCYNTVNGFSMNGLHLKSSIKSHSQCLQWEKFAPAWGCFFLLKKMKNISIPQNNLKLKSMYYNNRQWLILFHKNIAGAVPITAMWLQVSVQCACLFMWANLIMLFTHVIYWSYDKQTSQLNKLSRKQKKKTKVYAHENTPPKNFFFYFPM